MSSRIAPRRQLALTIHLALLALPAVAVQPSATLQVADAGLVRQYNLPAGPLSTVLSRFAGEAGIALSANASLTDGKHAPALSGSHTPAQGLQLLLAGSGLEAMLRAPGSYVLRVQAAPSRD